jgi:ACS family hexuronate transporter-like MFS transporter
MFPKSTIGTLTGIAQFAAGLGSFIVNKSAGKLFTFAAAQGDAFAFCGFTGKEAGYFIMFAYCAVAYLIGWTCMKTLVPKYKKVEL